MLSFTKTTLNILLLISANQSQILSILILISFSYCLIILAKLLQYVRELEIFVITRNKLCLSLDYIDTIKSLIDSTNVQSTADQPVQKRQGH